MTRMAINGLGRIGRAVFKQVMEDAALDPRASIIDCTLTQVVDRDLVKVMSWYDNEWGYAAQMVREAKATGADPRGG